MATHVIDERKLSAAGFVRTATNITRGQSLWERADEPNRSFLDEEAAEWLEEQAKEKKK